jgi:ribosome-associated protein
MSGDLPIARGIVVPAAELEWTAVRSGGPGGQNVNKVSTKVELRFDLPGTRALDPAVKARLAQSAGSRLDAQGRILITCDETRSQLQNLERARERLAALLSAALVVPKRRRPTRPSRGSKERRLEGKRHTAEKKSARRGTGD